MSARPTPSPASASPKPVISSRFEQAAVAGSPGEGPFPKFGGSRNACPGCKKAVSPMERGVIPGPQGTRWHSSCLVCGGKKTRPISWYGREEKGKPGCGKRLDSAAKSDGEGGVWCRECIVSFWCDHVSDAFLTMYCLAPSRHSKLACTVPDEDGAISHLHQFWQNDSTIYGDHYHSSSIYGYGQWWRRRALNQADNGHFRFEPDSKHQPDEADGCATKAEECHWNEKP